MRKKWLMQEKLFVKKLQRSKLDEHKDFHVNPNLKTGETTGTRKKPKPISTRVESCSPKNSNGSWSFRIRLLVVVRSDSQHVSAERCLVLSLKCNHVHDKAPPT